MKKIVGILLAIVWLNNTQAQKVPVANFYEQIKKYDLSEVLAPDSIGDGRKIKKSEILGFIGDNYQRFYIHFISIIQNPTNSYEYFAYGKTKVKQNICTFQGTIKVSEAKLNVESGDCTDCQQGYAVCDVLLFEDGKLSGTGFFEGKLTTNFTFDTKGNIEYDAIYLSADGFSNNGFVGNWTSYKTKIAKKCHWGDYRIPESSDLDIGAGEFIINDKYVNNGWENFMLCYYGREENPKVKAARQKEKEQWWK
ncbi:hypothetical protein FACS1894156_6880 [Bacteroidia bacterium]|nr:hypothetical protein FACS1894156_6880 [Bacteroidia bacterium]